jgi:hypothetical protein
MIAAAPSELTGEDVDVVYRFGVLLRTCGITLDV